jgi:hypothetical protein
MPTRLSRMGHPVHKLDEQFRYRPVFAEFSNRRTYDGELRSHPSTNEITANSGYLEAMEALVPTGPAPAIGPLAKDDDPDVPYLGIWVRIGLSFEGPRSRFRAQVRSLFNGIRSLRDLGPERCSFSLWKCEAATLLNLDAPIFCH